MSYRIGSFNIRKLSYATKDEDLDGDNKNVSRDFTAIGEIIRNQSSHCDVVALQEILNENVLKLLFPEGCGWKYSWAPSRSKMDDSSEGYAFAWNERRIVPVCEPMIWTQYKYDDVLGNYGLIRHPYYGRFTPSGSACGGPYVEFRLINTHIRYNPKINNLADASSIELRKREFKVLSEQILAKLTKRIYGNEMTDPHTTFQKITILLGDYNLNLKSSPASSPYVEEIVTIADGNSIREIVTVQNELTTLRKRREVNSSTGDVEWKFEGLANNYDHFTYDSTFFGDQGISAAPGVINAVHIFKGGDYEKYWREISDHLPIILDIDFV